jgi:uncharacterized protein (TIGR04255 family)
MPLKDVPRVHYHINPLIEVVSQVRFPRLLSIEAVVPSAFQDGLFSSFPIPQTTNEIQQQLSVDMTDDANPIPKFTQIEKKPNYAFISEDGKWRVNLTSTFLSLSTLEYTSWEDFNEKLNRVLGIFLSIYSPVFYERVGIRYVDSFTRSKFGVQAVDWQELIEPVALGFLGSQDIKNDIKVCNSVTEFNVGNDTFARISTNLGYVNKPDEKSTPELSFILDTDIFAFKTKKEELESKLNYIHGISTKIIRSVIKDRLHEAMEPEEI